MSSITALQQRSEKRSTSLPSCGSEKGEQNETADFTLDERYAVANAPLSQFDDIYSAIDSGKTKQISILTDNGEQILTVYGYDGDGNLLVAGVGSGKPMGKICIDVQAMIFYDAGEWSMRSWYEFSWGELTSESGCVITVF